MNIEQKVMVLRELRKQHAYLIEEFDRCAEADTASYKILLTSIQEKIEQILKTI